MAKKKRKWKVLDEEEYYKEEGRGIVSISEEQNNKTRIVRFAKQIKTTDGKWIYRTKPFTIPIRFVGKVVDILCNFARKFGYIIPAISKPEERIKELKKQLNEMVEQKVKLQRTTEKLETEIQNYRKSLKELRNQILKNNLDIFRLELKEFEQLLQKCGQGEKKEEDLQVFLTEKCWLFSPEYHGVKPKKPVGSKSVFDFYLEDYKSQGTIIELKLPSENIFCLKEKYGLSPKVGEALGQLIRYVETTIAYSHSERLSKIEDVHESKPLGFLIIGRTKTKQEVNQLKIVNSYLHFIQILSYDMLLNRAREVLNHWIGQ